MIRNLLLADDDEDDTDMFSEALQNIDAHIVLAVASNGREALTKLNDLQPAPEIIFLDINMPEMDGWDCLASIKKNPRFRDIPCVILSTSSTGVNGRKAIHAGAMGYFEKPSSFMKLQDFLRELYDSKVGMLETMRSIASSKTYHFVVA